MKAEVDTKPVEAEPPPTTSPTLSPLALSDSRFTMLRALLLKEMRKKFLKLFRHTEEKDRRVIPDEMAVFLAMLAFEELKNIDMALMGQPPVIRAQHDPFILFTKVLQQLVDQYHLMVAPPTPPTPLPAPEEKPPEKSPEKTDAAPPAASSPESAV